MPGCFELPGEGFGTFDELRVRRVAGRGQAGEVALDVEDEHGHAGFR